MNYELKAILDVLRTDHAISSVEIASSVHLSDKTVRTRLKILANELSLHGAELKGKPGIGYRLIIHHEQEFLEWFEEDNKEIPTTFTGRVYYVLTYLLNHSAYIKLDDICEMLFVSRNTITTDLKQVEEILNLYQLKITRRPNYGICLKGSEFNRRRCIADCLYKNNLNNGLSSAQKIESHVVSKIANKIAKKYRMKMSESSYESLIVYVVIANERIRLQQALYYTDEVREEIIQLVGNKAIHAAEEMSDEIANQIGVIYDEDERVYLALHLCGKVNLDHQERFGNNFIISSQIDELVLEMLNAVFEGFSLDFRDNLDLRMSLNQHMIPLDIRLRYDIPMKNPILDQIKNEYAFPYTIALCASNVLKDKYQKEIIEDEIGYLAVLFALAMKKKTKANRKYNIIVVCASGRGTSQLFMMKYKQVFGEYINRIYECSVFELEDFSFEEKQIDFIFSTIAIHIPLPIPVYEVSLLLNEKEITDYQRIFEHGDDDFITHYFQKDLFIPCLKAVTKEEALKQLCIFTENIIAMPNDFFSSVMKREEMGQTDFGNLVAIPHACRVMGCRKFVTVAILEKPIWWGNFDVQVIFLISLSEDDSEIEQFYQMITNYLSDSSLVSDTIENRTYINLINQLKIAYKL